MSVIEFNLFYFSARKVGDKLFKKENSYPMDFPDFYPEKAAHNCHYCGKGFSYKKGLRRHLRQMHEPVSIKSEMDEDPDWQIGGEFSHCYFTGLNPTKKGPF